MKNMRICKAGIIAVSLMTSSVVFAQVSYEEYYKLGSEYAAQGNFTSAEQEFLKGLNTDYPFISPLKSSLEIIEDLNSKKIKPRTALSLFEGISCEIKKELPKAMSAFTKAIASNPAYASGYCLRGSLHSLKGEYAQAMADFNKAIELKPRYPEAYLCRGVTYALKKMLNPALADVSVALTFEPRYAEAFYARGTIYMERGSYLEAISDFTKALNLYAKYELAFIGRAKAYATTGHYNEALLDLNQVITLNPKKASNYLTKAMLCEKTGLAREAKEAYAKFIEYAPFTAMDQINYARQRIVDLERIVGRGD